MNKGFWRSGHTPTLLSAFLYFDIAFMIWVMLGPLAVQIATSLELTPAQKGLMVATPVLAGGLLRVVMGVLVDHLKPKMAGWIGQGIVIAALAWAWLAGIHSFREIMVLGVALGFAGAAFAVALPLVSRWYPPQHQAPPWASPAPAIPARCWPPCWRPVWPWPSAGTISSASP